jgi:hypothetical protein
MPALGFNAQFAPFVEDGTKPHTIRARRKRPIMVGDMLRFYVGMRTKQCRLLRDWTKCLAVRPVFMWRPTEFVEIGNVRLDPDQLLTFAWMDGFRGDTYEENMRAFWEHFCPQDSQFSGVLISWFPRPLL